MTREHRSAGAGIDVFHWNPRRPVLGRVGYKLGVTWPVNNFGDLIGPLVVKRMLEREGLSPKGTAGDRQLASVGSILHLVRSDAVVWGSGVNGKVEADLHDVASLDVRAVRGPRTRDFLTARGASVPEVFGDPALLLPVLEPGLARRKRRRRVTVVPNLNDRADYSGQPGLLNPRLPLRVCLNAIAASQFVTGSSLHAIIVAEALGIPARLIRSSRESEFKYSDYYAGTGRATYEAAESVLEAEKAGGEPAPQWSPQPLIDAFPYDLWERAEVSRRQ